MRRVLVLVVVLAAGLLLFFWRRPDEAGQVLDLDSSTLECTVNLRDLYKGFQRYALAHPEAPVPPRAGVAVLGVLVAEGELAGGPEERRFLTCPGPGAAPVRPDVDYRAVDRLTEADTAYALRDFVAFPLAHFPAGGDQNEALAACDDAHGMNHPGCLNVLYTDGSVKTFTLEQEIERGTLPPGATTIRVGEDSPLPELRVLVGE